MIDTKELRRLTQAATPGPWINHGRQPNVAGLPHSAVAAKTLLARVYSETYGDVEQETANASFITAANPAAITELLDRLEAAERERDFAKTEIARLHDDIRELTDERVLDEEDRELWTTLKAQSAEKENAKLREALVEKVVSETMLRDLSLGNGSINASFEGGAVHLFVDAFATQLLEQFLESGATNYLEMSFRSNVTGPLVVTLQRVNGKTAHQLRAEAEKERDALRVELETERARLAACGVVALANTPDSAKRARDMRPEYWSASCGDVASLVDENIKLRAKI